MPPFKSLFVELVSFLTLFALMGTMTSNFWEKYLIQSELSNLKSSLHLLKQTVHHIATAYDNLHYELKSLADIKEIMSINSRPEELTHTHCGSMDIFNTFSSMVEQEEMKIKANKSVDNSISEKKSIGIAVSKGNDKSIDSAELRGNDKSIGNNLSKGNGKNISIPESKGKNNLSRVQHSIKFNLTNATTATRNPLKSTGVNIVRELENNPNNKKYS